MEWWYLPAIIGLILVVPIAYAVYLAIRVLHAEERLGINSLERMRMEEDDYIHLILRKINEHQKLLAQRGLRLLARTSVDDEHVARTKRSYRDILDTEYRAVSRKPDGTGHVQYDFTFVLPLAQSDAWFSHDADALAKWRAFTADYRQVAEDCLTIFRYAI